MPHWHAVRIGRVSALFLLYYEALLILFLTRRHASVARKVLPTVIYSPRKRGATLGFNMATILVVDDSPVIQRMLSFTLKRNRHTVLTARHGKLALQLLNKRAVDLVITDVTMPEMDGLTLLKELRSDARYKSLPVVMLTASGQEGDRMNAEAEGANGFLTKPTSSRELIETVNKLVG